MALRANTMQHTCQRPRCNQSSSRGWRLARAALVAGLAVALVSGPGATHAASPQSLAEYLATWELTPAAWQGLFEPAGEDGVPDLSPAAGRVVVRLLDRLRAAPPAWQQAWAADAVSLAEHPAAGCLQECMPVRLAGLVTDVHRIDLPAELAAAAGRGSLGIAKVVPPAGRPVWVMVPDLPSRLPNGSGLAERGGAIALLVADSVVADPLVADSGPVPATAAPPPLVAVAASLSWWPDTPLSRCGMDAGLFDTVRDGRPLEAAEAEAFYAGLAASGCAAAAGDKQPAGRSIVPLLDPTREWFAEHRGERLTIEGTARRIMRVPVDEPRWRNLLGRDHYWEIFVFVATPPLKVAGHLQESYPVVCCCLDLPPGLPQGERINEPLAIDAFAFKRYRYETRRGTAANPQGRPQEAPLLLAATVQWLPAPRPLGLPAWGQWLPAVVLVAAMGGLLWSFLRAGRRPPGEPLPERIDLPVPGDDERGAESPAKPPDGPSLTC